MKINEPNAAGAPFRIDQQPAAGHCRLAERRSRNGDGGGRQRAPEALDEGRDHVPQAAANFEVLTVAAVSENQFFHLMDRAP